MIENSGLPLRAPHLDEATAATLGVDLLEALIFFSLLDDAQSNKEQGNCHRHETISHRESVIQRIVGEIRDGRNTLVVQDRLVEVVDEILACTELATYLDQIRIIEVPTAAVHVLDGSALCWGESCVDGVEVCALCECVVPHDSADGENAQDVAEDDPVEDDETDGDMVGLDDGEDGYDHCGYQHYT